jgi:hypothetical protein
MGAGPREAVLDCACNVRGGDTRRDKSPGGVKLFVDHSMIGFEKALRGQASNQSARRS